MWYSYPLENFFKQTFTFQVFILTSLLFEDVSVCVQSLYQISTFVLLKPQGDS